MSALQIRGSRVRRLPGRLASGAQSSPGLHELNTLVIFSTVMLFPTLHHDPAVSASLLPDTHKVKLPTEALQLLGNFFHARSVSLPNLPRPSHANHPTSLWICAHVDHARLVWRYAMAMTTAYTHCFGREHGTRARLLAMRDVLFDPLRWPAEDPTAYRQPPATIDSAGDELAAYIRARAGDNHTLAYQLYYALYKRKALRSCGKSGVNLWRFGRSRDAEPVYWRFLATIHNKAPLPGKRTPMKRKRV